MKKHQIVTLVSIPLFFIFYFSLLLNFLDLEGFQLLEYGARRFLYEQYQFLPEPVKSNAITDLMSLSSLAGFADDLGLSSFLVLQDCSSGAFIFVRHPIS